MTTQVRSFVGERLGINQRQDEVFDAYPHNVPETKTAEITELIECLLYAQLLISFPIVVALTFLSAPFICCSLCS